LTCYEYAYLAANLSNGFVGSASGVRLAVREEPINNHADDREEEDDEAPEDLVDWRAV
jgi:hypothetical protein